MLKKLLLILLYSITSFSQQEKDGSIYENISYLSTTDNLSIHEVIHKFENKTIKKERLTRIYKKLGNKNWWFHFPVEKSKEERYFTLSFPYLSYGKVYLKKSDTVIPLHATSYYKEFPYQFLFYRHPTWGIPNDSIHSTNVFLKVKNDGSRTRLEFHLESRNDFLKRTQLEYIQFGLFLAFLSAIIIVLLFFSILKKEYSVIFYTLYIGFMLIEFLAGKGLGIQYIWSDSSFLINSSRSFSQTLGTLCIGLFYLNFYKLNFQQEISKQIFKWGIYLTIPIIIIYIYKYFFGGLSSFYLYVWIILKLVVVSWFFNHLYLSTKKQIPFYLLFAFALPIISIVISQSINPKNNSSDWWIYGTANIYYIALVIEILIFTRYIFDAVIKSQKKYIQLKKVSDELKYNFQYKTLQIEQQERNKLLNNIHDSFGGYLEALKLRLSLKSDNTPEKTQEILDSFYQEYRYLLNSLYAPKINSENLVENLIEFCSKLNEITNNIIHHNFSLNNIAFSQDKCLHIYRIISELVTNAIKYSKASEIKVTVKKYDTEIILIEVSDNGIGFDKNAIDKNRFGLNSVKNRVNQIHGEIYIDSNKKQGSKITIKTSKND